ncbi:MAG TPA: NAD(P)-dependent oxidoreductase [Dongiaceae bacterium]|nr:NAD(P)-dependent oxidoreductase [Dongiaceae bacterium]
MRMVGFINPNLGELAARLAASDEVEFADTRSLEELREKAAGAEAALVSNSTYNEAVAEILNAAAGLRWIQTTSIGFEALIAHPPRRGIIVTNPAGLKAPTVAEHAMLLLLAVLRNLPGAMDGQRSSRWASRDLAPTVRSLAGKRVICLGYGAIGRSLAAKLAAFDAEVIAVTRSGKGPPPATVILPLGELDRVLPTADAVLLALPLADGTRHIIDAARLGRMKPDAVIVNVGRGELIDEAALARALEAGKLGGAGLDVFAKEPLAETSPLWRCPRTVLTPHLGGLGGDGDRLLAELINANAARLKRGEPLVNVVWPT